MTKVGAGTLTMNASNSYTGPTNVNQGTLKIGPGSVDQFSASTIINLVAGTTLDLVGSNGEAVGGLSGAGTVITGSGANIGPGQNNQDTTFSGVITGTGSLDKYGSGTLTLTGNNTYFGGQTTVTAAGTLKLAAGNTLPDQTRVTLSVSGATLDLDNADEEIGGLSGVAGSIVSLGTATLTTGSNNETLNFDGNITGTGGLTKIGNGTQRLRAANSFTGDINVNDGTLEIGVGNTLGNNAVIVAAGATLRVAGDGESFGSLAGAGTVESAVSGGVNPGFNNLNTTFSGDITGIGPFVKSGTGTMTMSGLSDYTGDTTINDGSLTFDGASAGLTSTASITLNGGDATIKNGAAVNSPGAINLQTTASSLLIESGGMATAFQTNIGLPTGSDGSATVTGVASRMQNSGRTRVGDAGKGTLNVLNGGRVVTGERLAIADSGTGSANSAVVIDGFLNNGLNGTFGDDDDEVSRVDADFAVFVGDAATAQLTIQNGGRIISGTGSNDHSTNYSIIGTVAVADGSIATITGDKSRWVHNGYMEVARAAGDATNPVELRVLDGGYAEFSYMPTSTQDGSRSKITIDGANSTLHLRDARGDAGVVAAGIGDIRMVTSGSNGYSEIFVTAGGLLDLDTDLEIGRGVADTAGQAHVTVDGSGSTLDAGKELTVAYQGSTGSLTITDGGTVNSGISSAVDPGGLTRDSFVSRTSGNGTVNVGAVAGMDAGHAAANWNVGEDLFIAGIATGNNSSGVGTLNINPTGHVSVTGQLRVWDRGIINLDGGELAFDSINLTDSSASIAESPTLNFNSGTLRFTTSPEVTLGGALLAEMLGANPTLTAGQELAVDNTAVLSAPLRNNGGTLTVGAMDAASAANLDFDAGTLNLTNANLTVGVGGIFGSTLVVGAPQSISVTNQATIDAGAQLVVAGTFRSGGLTNNGDLVATNATIGGPVANNNDVTVVGMVNFDGLVSGPGDFFGPGTANFSGGLAPGASPAEISFDGGISLADTNTLFIEIGGLTPGSQYDRLVVDGGALVDGILDVSLIDGFAPTPGQQFTILSAGSIVNNGLVLGGSAAGSFSLLVSSSSVILQAVAGIQGDYNQDGTVNAADYTVWRNNLGSLTSLPNDDTAGVGQDDYARWKSHFGELAGSGSGAGSSAAVPEPATLGLLAAALFALAFRRLK